MLLRDLAAMTTAVTVNALAGAGRARVPEPMVMLDEPGVEAFHQGGTNPAMASVYDFSARCLDTLIPPGGRVLDLGIGSGRAAAHLVRRRPDLTVTGVDLSDPMLRRCAELAAEPALAGRISTVQADISALTPELLDRRFDAVCSVWTLHQLPEQAAVEALRRIAEIRRRHGSAVWLLDFHRLRSARAFPLMMRIGEPGYPPLLLGDALASEAAAFRAGELGRLCAEAGLTGLSRAVSRPLPFLQVHWAPGADAASAAPDAARPGRPVPLDPATARRAAMVRTMFAGRSPRPTR